MSDAQLMAGPEPKARKKAKKKRSGLNALDDSVPAKHHLVHVNVNVVNQSGSGETKKKGNDADDALRNLRGY